MSTSTPELAARRVVAALAADLWRILEIKALSDIIQGYVDDLSRDMLDVLDGDLAKGTAQRRHRTYLRRDAEPAYMEGMKEGGADPDEITAEEQQQIESWVSGQGGFVPDFWDAVGDLAKRRGELSREEFEAARRGLYDRITLWESSLRELAGMARASALANVSCTWELGATEKHCRTCARLNGQRHRLKWFTDRGYIPQQNGSDTLECGGWQCDCRLVDDDGRVLLP